MFPLDEKFYVLGFDPGGPEGFGWSICEVFGDIVLPARGGAASHVAEVMDKVVNYIHREANIMGIGIAAPLFWSPTGTRRVDGIIREALTASGHPGTRRGERRTTRAGASAGQGHLGPLPDTGH